MKLKDTQALTSFEYKWLLKRIFPYIKPFMGRVILGFLVAIPVGLLDGVVSFSLKPYMDYVVGKQDLAIAGLTIPYMTLAYAMPFAIILFAALQGVLRYLNTYLTDWTSLKITNAVKVDLFSTLVRMDSSFFDQNTSGIILNRYLSDPDTASKGIVDNLTTLIISVFGAVSLVVVMLHSSWKLALVGVVVLGAAFLPVSLIRKKIKSVSNKNMVITGDIMTTMNETYSGNRVITAYNLQERQNKNFNQGIINSFNVTISLTKRVGWMSPIMYMIASCGIAFVLFYGTKLIYDGQMTAGGFASFVTSLLLLYKPVKSLGRTLSHIQNIFVAMGRVFELFDYVPKIIDKENTVQVPEIKNGITFENVCFEYVENKPVLKNINLNVAKGETLAIVGNSGGGKSTIVNLIPRFYDVNSGCIKIDNTDIRDIKLADLRNNISFVFQDNFLFTGTIRENILLAKPDATEEELQQALKASHLQEVISTLPDGLDTLLGERGLTLSGGQRQRVAIARAMIRNTPIIILDEATSALDNESEAIVQKALDNLMQNKTVFVIAHRLSTIKNADRIAVINDGCLVELGTHEQLLNIKDGQYKHLYDMQFKNLEEKTV
ncbi:MAG: ATP-binding cassette domain-containing protein [Candidatus Gastranaerophilales bacterium]|nr:ATP-binding cassette domain-containing protein [Candidatus Gastranaerophilales bacterium]